MLSRNRGLNKSAAEQPVCDIPDVKGCLLTAIRNKFCFCIGSALLSDWISLFVVSGQVYLLGFVHVERQFLWKSNICGGGIGRRIVSTKVNRLSRR